MVASANLEWFPAKNHKIYNYSIQCKQVTTSLVTARISRPIYHSWDLCSLKFFQLSANIAESNSQCHLDILNFPKGIFYTLCFPDCSNCLHCSHRTILISSFALEDRLLSCHFPLSSEAIAAKIKHALYKIIAGKWINRDHTGKEAMKCTFIRNHV